MAKFYLTATSAEGQRETKAVKADSLAQARQKLIDRGWTDIVIHTDDVWAINQTDIPDSPFSPDEYIKLAGISRFGFFLMMLEKLYKQWATPVLLGCVALGLGVVFLEWWAIILGTILLVVPLRLAYSAAFGDTAKRRYDALVLAASWYRWDDVERLLPQQRIGFPLEERAFRSAEVLAGRGDLDGAIKRYDSMIAGHNVPEWFAETRRAPLCLIAQKLAWKQAGENGAVQRFDTAIVDRALQHYAHAVELDEAQAVTRIDYAKTALKYRRDVRTAKRLLESASELPAAELALFFADYVRGILVLEENSPEEAIQLIRQFQQKMSSFMGNPVVLGVIDEASMFLTLAYAQAGLEEKAQKQFKRCEPRIIANNELELHARCRQALGLSQR